MPSVSATAIVEREPEPAAMQVRDEFDTGRALGAMLANPDALAALDVDKIKELHALFSHMKAERARVQYHSAFTAAQSAMKPVYARGVNEHTRSKYALLEDVLAMLMPVALQHGFSVSFSTGTSDRDGHERVIMFLRHIGGYEERHELDAPIDTHGPGGKQNKTGLHGMKSTLTYCQRALLCSVFNVQIAKDDDGNAGAAVGPSAARLTADEQKQIADGMKSVNGDWDTLYSYLGVARLEDAPRSCFRDVMTSIARKRAEMKGGA